MLFPHLADYLPPLPAKAYLFGSLDPETVRVRQSHLETYLLRLLTEQQLSPIVTSPPFDKFLMITERLKQIRGKQSHDSQPTESGNEPLLAATTRHCLSAKDAQRIFERTSPASLTATGLTEMEANVAELHKAIRSMRTNSNIEPELQQLIEACRVGWPRLKATGNLEGNHSSRLLAQRALQCDEDLTILAGALKTLLLAIPPNRQSRGPRLKSAFGSNDWAAFYR